jgi:hypothetical protein
MTTISKQWNTDENYWNLHPQNKLIKAFGDLFDSDKSKTKENSSKLMWAIALYMDPHEDNPYKNLGFDEKQHIIATDYLKDKKFNWEDKAIVNLVETYEESCLTLLEKELYRLEEKVRQRGNFLKTTTYTLDSYGETGKLVKGTADQLDKMMLNTSKIYQQVAEIRSRLEEEKSSSKLRGGAAESASESKLM